MPLRFVFAGLFALAIAAGYFALSTGGPENRSLAFALLAGTAFGAVLQRSRFCFYCNFRDLIEKREPAGVLALLVALAVGAIGYTTIFGAWLPTPAPGRLPPTAHIGPVSVVLAGASFVFGLGMAISGSCLSAHFYRLAEGSPASPFAIIGAALGFGLGFLTWNPLFELATSQAVIIWLPHTLGYAGSLLLTLGALTVLAILVLWFAKPANPSITEPLTLRGAANALFIRRWPAIVGGVLVGLIGTLYYFRVAPLGVTAELGSLVRTAGTNFGIVPGTLFGLDTLRGCATIIKEALLSENGLFVMGLIGAAFVTSLIANQFQPRLPNLKDVSRGLVGGVLLGWGSMTALGCTVGVLLSGIHAGAVSGWVFLACCAGGILAAWGVQRLFRRGARAAA